ncbi:hypothetical protein DXG01_006745 [Tephrocybe rancida]|nr:hypothetical protein DXG01_006745 [Tephrocybe rancida]
MSAVRSGKTQLLQEFEAKLNIQKLLDDGGRGWYHHMERLAASTPLSAGFGVHCPTGDEPVLKDVLGVRLNLQIKQQEITLIGEYNQVLDELVNLSAPSASIINVLPFLDLIPGPMPWRTRAKSFRMRDADVYGRLVEDAVTGKNSGMNTWAAAFADVNKPEGDQRQLLSQLNAVSLVKLIQIILAPDQTVQQGAIETTSALLQSFVLACIRYPKWMTWAQREIDAIVGPDRLPSFTDRPFLPCVEAILRETLRWRPAARFGLPHQSIADDVIEYQGQEYFIPKGSVIFGVTWAIEHDGTRFESPDDFMPERFLDAEGKLKSNYETSAFGFGRRVCPGIPFAERTLWINIATMLWNFDIQGSNELDPNTGSPHIYDDSDAAFSGYVTNPPFKFPAVFRSRSLQREEVARREWAECEKDLNVLLPAPKSDN